jgi:hypothetical protein
MKISVILLVIAASAVLLQYFASRKQRYSLAILIIALLSILLQFGIERQGKAELHAVLKRSQEDQFIIASITIFSRITVFTEARSPGGGVRKVGFTDFVELRMLEGDDTSSIRFESVPYPTGQQVDSNTAVATCKYAPEDPAQVLGKPLSSLESVTSFNSNYMTGFTNAVFRLDEGFGWVAITVFVNGREVVHKEVPVTARREGWKGLEFGVQDEFRRIVQTYRTGGPTDPAG